MKTTLLSFGALCAIFIGSGFRLAGYQEPARPPWSNFDRRRAPQVKVPEFPDRAAAVVRLRAAIPNVRIDFDGVTRGPKMVCTTDGFLTGPGGAGRAVEATTAADFGDDPHRAAKAFLKEHRALFGHGPEVVARARLAREYVTPHNGLRTVVWAQQVDDIPVFGALLIAHTTRQGELVNISSRFLPDAERAADRGNANRKEHQLAPPIPAPAAVALAANNVGEALVPGRVTAVGEAIGSDRRQFFRASGLRHEAEASLVWLPVNSMEMRLCWQVTFISQSRGEMYRILIEAVTGEVWVRQCLTRYLSDASYRVFTSDSPSPFSPGHTMPLTNQPPLVPRVLLTLSALDTNASPLGWISDGDNETRGNNVDAHLDHDGDDQPDLPRPQGEPPRTFDFPLELNLDPTNYSRAAVVQLFYWCNWMHDTLYGLGFTEAAGNFQNLNFGRGGQGNDAVRVDAQDGSGVNNANIMVPPDGRPPLIQMFLYTGATPRRDSALDAEVILHEYTHGLTDRSVGGGWGLNESQSRGLAEGWSDFYSLALLGESGDDIDGVYPHGGYLCYLYRGLTQNYYFGIRRYPYCTDQSKSPLTFKDIDPLQASPHPGVPLNPLHSPWTPGDADEEHRQGEVWCAALWDVRAKLIRRHGFILGNRLMLQLATDGLRLAPAEPNFLQARDALLQADWVNTGGANQQVLWAGFAKRGMGLSATSPDSSTTRGVSEAFDVPDALHISPFTGLVASGPVGGPFAPSAREFVLTNLGFSPLTWTAGVSAAWLHLTATNGILLPGGTDARVTAWLDASVTNLGQGVYTNTLWFSNLTSGVLQERRCLLRVACPDYYSQWFQRGNELDYTSLTFTPDGSVDFYELCRDLATTFPTDPAGGTVLPLADDDYHAVVLSGTNTVALYNLRTNRFFVGGNGYLTFGEGDGAWAESYEAHFRLPRIAALFDALGTGQGGTVSWKALHDRVAVTYRDVPEWWRANTNNFQIELFYDGTLRLTYLNLDATDGLIGLSAGGGVPPDFVESDLLATRYCVMPVLLALPDSAIEGDGTLTNGGAVVLPQPISTNLLVNLLSLDTTELAVTTNVVIPAGETLVRFDLHVIDDPQLDGTQAPIIRAAAAGCRSGQKVMLVHDNETATLTLSLPSVVHEGAGQIQGTVSSSTTPSGNIEVALSSSDPTEIRVPPSVLIPAGARSIGFGATVVNDGEVDGPQVVTVVASVRNWTEGRAVVSVLDNEPTNLVVTLPSGAMETDGIGTNLGTVLLSGVAPTNVVVGLQSSDTTELRVPSAVAIPAGTSGTVFNLEYIDDAEVDGVQNVTVTATASGFSFGAQTIHIYDNESPPFPCCPSPLHLARDVKADSGLSWRFSDLPKTTFTNEVYLATQPLPGPGDLVGTTTGTSLHLPLLAPLTTYYWQVIARGDGISAGPVWKFTTRGTAAFDWSMIPSPQYVNEGTAVAVTARDEFDRPVTNYAGPAWLLGREGYGTNVFKDDFEDGNLDGWVLEGGSNAWAVTREPARGQYSLTLNGGAYCSFENGRVHAFSNLTPTRIRFWARVAAPEVNAAYFIAGDGGASSNAVMFRFNADGTLGLFGNCTPQGCPWHAVPYEPNRWYQIAIYLDWVRQRLDFYVNDSLVASNVVFAQSEARAITAVRLFNCSDTQAWWDEIELGDGPVPRRLALTPGQTGRFTNGVWRGLLRLLEPATDMYLLATNAAGQVGSSGRFVVESSADADADGLPDSWERRWFGSTNAPAGGREADPDEDHLSNYAECQAGTHPLDPLSVLRVAGIEWGADRLRFRFDTVAAKRYQLEQTDSFSPPNWTAASGFIYGDGELAEIDLPHGPLPRLRFYRVCVRP